MFKPTETVDVGRILLDSGMISSGNLLEAIERRQANGRSIVKNLIDLGYADEEKIANCLSRIYAVPSTFISRKDSIYYLIDIIAKSRRCGYTFLPLDLINTIVTVASTNPPDEATLKYIEEETGLRLRVLVLTDSEYDKYISRTYDFLKGHDEFRQPLVGSANRIKTSSYEGGERRRFPRYNKSLKVKYEINREYNINRTVNVSLGGLLMKSSFPAAVDSYVVARLELPTSYQDMVIVAKIVRVERVATMKNYEIALDFYSMDISDKRRFSEYLNSVGC